MKVTCTIDRLIKITRDQWAETGDKALGSALQPLVFDRRNSNHGGLQSIHVFELSRPTASGKTPPFDQRTAGGGAFIEDSDDTRMAAA
jgi:hypothetical protein